MATPIPSEKSVVIIGGHGKVALHLTRLLESTHAVTSVIRDSHQSADIDLAGGKPFVLSVEEDPVEKFAELFEGYDVVVWLAGAGGKATEGKSSEERTEAVDYKGAVKIFDALESMEGKKPFFILLSAIDIRDENKIPEHYNDADKAVSERMRKAIPAYVKWKYEADKNLVKRTSFKWCILRPGGLTDKPATGKAEIGRTHITEPISRQDVAKVLALLVDREDAAGLAIDLVGGESNIVTALDAAIKKGETDFLG